MKDNKDLLEWYEKDDDIRSAGLAFAGTGNKENRDAGIQHSPGDGDEAPLPSVAVEKDDNEDSRKPDEEFVRVEKSNSVREIETKAELFKAVAFSKVMQDILSKTSDSFSRMPEEDRQKLKSNIKELADKVVQVLDGI